MAEASEERAILLSSMPAGPAERRLALIVVGISAAIFALLAPFAKVQLAAVPAFIPLYQSALVVNDLVIAAFLFGQFTLERSRALLVLGGAYLFTAFMAVFHALTFPGLFAPSGLLGAGPQTTAWLYMFWHGGFPLLVMAYVVLERRSPRLDAKASHAILAVALAAFTMAASLAHIATRADQLLPEIMLGHQYTPTMVGVVSSVWGLSAAALVLLWRQRPHTVLGLWLMVVMAAWIFDIGLSAVLNHGRFDLGFYAGRVYGIAAAAVLLVVLIAENVALHGRLARAHAAQVRESALVQQKTSELSAANRELEAFAYSVSHDLRTPLRAIDGYARMLYEEYGERLDAEGRRKLDVLCTNTRTMGKLIDDLLAMSRLARQPLVRSTVDMDALVREIVEELRPATEQRDVEFVVEPLNEVAADRALLRQILANLIGNAVKFTRGRGHAVIEVGALRSPEGERTFFVKDNGAGFDMQYSGKLFGVFQRLHHPDEYEGTGVGLAIVQRLVERHGGRVWADARPGEGATFFFTLAK